MQIASVKDYLANLINLSQSTTGAPINSLALPFTVQAFGQRPRDFTYVDANNNPIAAMAVVGELMVRDRRDTAPRNIYQTLNVTNGMPTGGYYLPLLPNNLRTGRRKQLFKIEILVRIMTTNPSTGGHNLDYLVDAIERTFLNLQLPIEATDSVTGEGWYMKALGESMDTYAIRPQRTENQNLLRLQKRIILNDLEVNYFS